MNRESVNLGSWTPESLNELLRQAASIEQAGERIAFLSARFLGTPYREDTLVGSVETDEVRVIDLAGMDCFTFLDYIEAMRLSRSFDEFGRLLMEIRYKSGVVGFRNRNHFFTDWIESNDKYAEDVTQKVGLGGTVTVCKTLNLKKDGTLFVPGIDPVRRDIRFIPSAAADDEAIGRLETGDYIGIYSALPGLDVSHAGIFIRTAGRCVLRHASSMKGIRKVVDDDFIAYVRNKPGIIVLRA